MRSFLESWPVMVRVVWTTGARSERRPPALGPEAGAGAALARFEDPAGTTPLPLVGAPMAEVARAARTVRMAGFMLIIIYAKKVKEWLN